MSKAGERLISAAQELLSSLRSDKWREYRTVNGTLVFTPAITVPKEAIERVGPLGPEFEAAWDQSTDKLYES